jgi:hypothetical protein
MRSRDQAFVRTLFTGRRRFFPGLHKLIEDERRGYHGLMSIVKKAIQCAPEISFPKGKLRNGDTPQLSRYKFDWVPRLHGLFDWDDGIYSSRVASNGQGILLCYQRHYYPRSGRQLQIDVESALPNTFGLSLVLMGLILSDRSSQQRTM